MDFAERVLKLMPEGAYFMLAKAQAMEASGRHVIHLELGQPDVTASENISQAGIDAIEEGFTRYTPSAGIPALRKVIAEDASRRRGIPIEPAQVVVGPGAKPALFFPTLALVRPGDEVIYPDPGFPTYAAMIDVAGGTPVPVPLREEEDFSFNLEAFDRLVNDHTRMVVLNSPSNPTGGVMPLAALEHIAEVARQRDLWVLSDEIYARLVYDQPASSIASLPGMAERTIICDGFSKTYAMTGWRLGYGIMPRLLAERVELLLTHSVGCTASFTQVAGIEAITGPQEHVEAVVAEYKRRRDALVAGLNDIPGVRCRMPQGAFYVFPNVTAFGCSSNWLAEYLLEETGVAVLPGTSFGKNGEGYLRLCFANSLENSLEALERMKPALAAAALGTLKGGGK
ncbi:MAG: aspartate aminotransferase [Chloroflexi bacterium RBG_16_57_11]|nr:MAG: aspartate aminotransferase [Chloroflexi bacterium RBG_16_57_11]